jgi:GxxExxY protein
MANNADQIRRIARDVYRVLGSGFSEGVYDRAMQVGLRLASIRYEGQKVVELKYKEYYVGEGYPDLVVRLGREKLIVELKAVSGEMGASEEQQLRNYMKILKIKRGLLVNFQQPGKSQRKTRLEMREIKPFAEGQVTTRSQPPVHLRVFLSVSVAPRASRASDLHLGPSQGVPGAVAVELREG